MTRRISLLLGCLILVPAVLAAQAPVPLEELVRRGDVYVHPETGQPYSGPVRSMWTRTRVKEQGMMAEGRWDGVHEWYHSNGQLSTRETWANGMLNGPSVSYFKTGQISIQENYRDGALHGEYESWWSRGRPAEKGMWHEGEPCGQWTSFRQTVYFPTCPAG